MFQVSDIYCFKESVYTDLLPYQLIPIKLLRETKKLIHISTFFFFEELNCTKKGIDEERKRENKFNA